MNQSNPVLSICIPAYNRPIWFKRALESIVLNNLNSSQSIEIIISDDSSSQECRFIAEKVLEKWQGSWQYVLNQTRLGMANNWNNSLQLASGEYVLVLHDDDFLLEDGIKHILHILKNNPHKTAIMLFGVNIIDAQKRVLKKQIFTRQLYLSPQESLLKLVSNSSFVRFPAIVIRRDVFEEVGYFDRTLGGIADFDMWIRLFSKFGVLCLPHTISAYTIHNAALTTEMFNGKVIEQLLSLFTIVKNSHLLNDRILKQSKSDFFHQFILAGVYRRLRQKDLSGAKKVMQLFDLSSMSQLNFSWKWFYLRIIFSIILLF